MLSNQKSQQIKDMAYGSYYELLLVKEFKKEFNIELNQYEDDNAIHDFYINDKDGNIIGLVELKTRRITKNQYPTIMIGYNKIVEGRRRVKDENIKFVVYVWGLDTKWRGKNFYYWIETMDTLGNEYHLDMNGNRKRGDDDKKVAMVYTKYLKPLKNLVEDLKSNDFI